MFPDTFSAIVTVLGSASFACIGWVFQRAYVLGTRVSVLETKQADLPNLINSKFDGMGYKIDAMNARLDRIERAMNGALYSQH
jgi:hypothetical protein